MTCVGTPRRSYSSSELLSTLREGLSELRRRCSLCLSHRLQSLLEHHRQDRSPPFYFGASVGQRPHWPIKCFQDQQRHHCLGLSLRRPPRGSCERGCESQSISEATRSNPVRNKVYQCQLLCLPVAVRRSASSGRRSFNYFWQVKLDPLASGEQPIAICLQAADNFAVRDLQLQHTSRV